MTAPLLRPTAPRLRHLLQAAPLCAAALAVAPPLAAQGPARPSGPLAAPAAASPGWSDGVLQAVNDARAAAGLQPLRPSVELERIAQQHSDAMARERRLSHDGFEARLDRSGRDLCVENVAGGTLEPRVLVNAWSRATLHRRNLLEPRVREAGLSANGRYVTLFACS